VRLTASDWRTAFLPASADMRFFIFWPDHRKERIMMNEIFLYNTLSKKIEAFVPHEAGKVKLYTCGPTVYHYAHIGNLRSYLMEDVLEKFLKYAGYAVTRVMNITDVGHIVNDADAGEDKMLAGARRDKKPILEIADFYTNAFFDDCAKLNIRKPDIIERATSCIAEYIDLITRLLAKGYAYEAGGNVYFDTARLEQYYVLANHTSGSLAVGVRADVDEDANKRTSSDFVLWFTRSKFGEQELRWDSPWGAGYPGWHIECSAISMKHLGEALDIHCGGVDNIFPHHTNEIAQSESVLGHKWCNYWFHVQHLNDQSGKMSKSKGDFLTVSLLEQKGYDPMDYRYFCLQSHYRKPLEFSYDGLDDARLAYNKLKSRIAGLDNEGDPDQDAITDLSPTAYPDAWQGPEHGSRTHNAL
jgi:cysteinyl-tRNA synthetase